MNGGDHGRKLLEAAKAKRDALLTATGRPRGELSAAIEEAEAASVRVDELGTERRAYDQEIDKLAQVRRELVRIKTDRVSEKAQGALTKAQDDRRAPPAG